MQFVGTACHSGYSVSVLSESEVTAILSSERNNSK